MSLTRFILAVVLALGVPAAPAGVTTTERPPRFELHKMPENTLVTPAPTSEADCLAKARASAGKWQCVTRRDLETVTTCADEKAPKIVLPKNAEGFYVEPDAAAFPITGSDTQWTTLQWLYVRNPTWPAGYPTCWIRGWAPPEEWRVNGLDPANVFMERIEPGMADIELPNLIEPPIIHPIDLQPP